LCALLAIAPAASFADNGVFTMKNGTKLNPYAFSGVLNLTEVVLPNDLYEIPEGAFQESSISTITIPDSVSIIGAYAFDACENLTTLRISLGVTSLGDGFFPGPVEIAPENPTFKSGPYGGIYTKDTNMLIMLPKGAGENGVLRFDDGIKFAEGAFSGNTEIVEVVLPSDLTEIPASMFANSSIQRVTLGSKVTKIGDYAFEGCSALVSIDLPEALTSIGAYAFKGCTGLTELVVKNNVTTIGKYAFDGCSGLTAITLSNTLTSIGDYAFRKCTKVSKIVIPYSIRSIGKYAFNGWKSTQTIEFAGRTNTTGLSLGSSWKGSAKLAYSG